MATKSPRAAIVAAVAKLNHAPEHIAKLGKVAKDRELDDLERQLQAAKDADLADVQKMIRSRMRKRGWYRSKTGARNVRKAARKAKANANKATNAAVANVTETNATNV